MKITENEIIKLITSLGFALNGKVYTKQYKDYKINIDFTNEKIIYQDVSKPKSECIQLGDETTSNFANSENFVVLECIDRLLALGYPPSSIYLEYKWSLGRQNKGKLDILVKEVTDDTPFLMIECKTWGEEFDKELRKMRGDGGQLLTYFKQDQRAKYLCLYASTLKSSNIKSIKV